MTTKHTPGPWRWELNKNGKRVQLCGGKPMYDLTVMDFVRYGMQNAAPRFRTLEDDGLNIMEHCEAYAEKVQGREHHASWFQTINHADARLIEAAPELLEALKWVSAALQTACNLERPIYEHQNIRSQGVSRKISDVLDQADAAIAKATNA